MAASSSDAAASAAGIDLSVLRVDGDNTVTNTGTLIKLPGKPASMRGRTQCTEEPAGATTGPQRSKSGADATTARPLSLRAPCV